MGINGNALGRYYKMLMIVWQLSISGCLTSCPRYICMAPVAPPPLEPPSSPSLYPSTRICTLRNRTENVYLLYACEVDEVCVPSLSTESAPSLCTPRTVPYAQHFPGEPCSLNSHCLAQLCTQGVCYGYPRGHTCLGDWDCQVGAICHSLSPHTTPFCQQLLDVGMKCGEGWGSCVEYARCNHGHCVRYFSLRLGSRTEYDLLCESGYSEIIKGEMICHEAPRLINWDRNSELPVRCISNLDCVYEFSNHQRIVTSSYSELGCKCGYNPEGYSFCVPGRGDISIQKAIQSIQSFVLLNPLCHTQRGMFCPQTVNLYGYEQAKKAWLMLFDYVSYIDQNQCLKTTYPIIEFWAAGHSLEYDDIGHQVIHIDRGQNIILGLFTLLIILLHGILL